MSRGEVLRRPSVGMGGVRWAVASQPRRIGGSVVEIQSVGVGWAFHRAGGFICLVVTSPPGDRGHSQVHCLDHLLLSS